MHVLARVCGQPWLQQQHGLTAAVFSTPPDPMDCLLACLPGMNDRMLMLCCPFDDAVAVLQGTTARAAAGTGVASCNTCYSIITIITAAPLRKLLLQPAPHKHQHQSRTSMIHTRLGQPPSSEAQHCGKLTAAKRLQSCTSLTQPATPPQPLCDRALLACSSCAPF